jgi:hypothetical protein
MVLLAALAIGCGGGSSAGIDGGGGGGGVDGGGGGASLQPADLEQFAFTAWCTHLTRCLVYPDVATCERSRTDDFRHGDDWPYAAALQAAVDAGKVTWDGAAATACITAEFDPAACSDDALDKPIDACWTYATGTGAASATCDLDAECASGRCERTCGGDACCPGTCAAGTAAPLHLGDTCEIDDGSGGKAFLACVDSACSAHTGLCAAYAELGESCGGGARCKPGSHLACDGTSCVTAPGAGDACSTAGDVTCDLGNERCLTPSDEDTDGTCIALGLSGAACTRDAQCEDAYRCDGTHCVDRAHLGEACTETADCMDRGYCDGTACVAPLPVGATCDQAGQQCAVACDGGTCIDTSACEL